MSQAGFVVSESRVSTHNNLYEFDQSSAKPPEFGTVVRFQIKPHCSLGADYLGRWAVEVELLIDQGTSIVVPRARRGPRVLAEQMLGTYGAKPLKIEAPLRPWPFDIDLVYTWVDADDPDWQRRRAVHMPGAGEDEQPQAATNAARWHSRDELRYSLRSVWQYAPFVRHIFIVTDRQVPDWLSAEPGISVIDHRDIYPDHSVLPTYNSNHIESVLHNIPGLTEHFLYLNDDFFFAAPVVPRDFFTFGGLGKTFFSTRHLDERPVMANDRATVASHKNARDLLASRFNFVPTQKFKHVPYAMKRSVWHDIERDFPEELAATRANRFRSWTDVNGQFLYAWYALLSGEAVPARIPYSYVEIGDVEVQDRLQRLESSKYKTFCINDADSTSETVELNDMVLRDFLRVRLPTPSPYEKGSATYVVTSTNARGRVDTRSTRGFESEVRDLGPDDAERRYRAILATEASPYVGRKLVRLLRNVGRRADAIDVLPIAYDDCDARRLAELNLRSTDARDLGEVADLVAVTDFSAFLRTLSYLGRMVRTEEHLAELEEILEPFPLAWTESSAGLARLAAATRRAGRPDRAIEQLERAVELLDVAPSTEGKPQRRDETAIVDPWLVVDDLLEVVAAEDACVFADAGTLLGLYREGRFLGHDYDIDFSTRSADDFASLRRALSADWRFELSNVRTPETIIQGRHVNGTYLDVFRHVREGDAWVKKSHVYGWRFSDFELGSLALGERSVRVPVPTEDYLTQMYGDTWSVPQPGFDSRLRAPNCFFPSSEEIICTLLNKLVAAKLNSDEVAATTIRHDLEVFAGYSITARV